MGKMRLDKLVSNTGYASRSEVKKLIKKEFLTIDGMDQGAIEVSMQVDPNVDMVRIHGELIVYEKDAYAMIYKPRDVMTDLRNIAGKKMIMDYLSPEFWYKGLFPVGRLSYEAEGLVLLVNDGALAHRVAHPKKTILRSYVADVRGEISPKDIAFFKKEIKFPKYTGGKIDMTVMEVKENETRVFLQFYERKTYELYDMFEKIEKSVLYLQAYSIGEIKLDDSLEIGETRALTPGEIAYLKQM